MMEIDLGDFWVNDDGHLSMILLSEVLVNPFHLKILVLVILENPSHLQMILVLVILVIQFRFGEFNFGDGITFDESGSFKGDFDFEDDTIFEGVGFTI